MLPRLPLSAVLVSLLAPPAVAQQAVLNYSIVGSSSCDTKPCFDQVMSNVPTQQLLLDVAHGPMDTAAVQEALRATAVTIKDLLALRLVRLERGRVMLNFALFTAADVARIRAVAEVHATSLASSVMAHAAEIDSALSAYRTPGVDPKAVAYIVLGCAALDWGGLELTAAKGYRTATQSRPDGQYVPHAEEAAAFSLRAIYWGSHNSTKGGFQFTSFGDHFSPRYALPDLFWQLPWRAARAGYPDSLQRSVAVLLDQSLTSTAREIGAMMVALRDQERSAEGLARVAQLDSVEVRLLLAVLVNLDYVTAAGNRYRANIPVFTNLDQPMINRLLVIGHRVMEEWLAAHYAGVKSDLQELSFMRSGVPFEDGFTMIWHYIFGIANRKLVEAGLFADPYGPARRFPGSIPAVYSADLEPSSVW